MSSWHAARTGHRVMPTPLQQVAINKLPKHATTINNNAAILPATSTVATINDTLSASSAPIPMHTLLTQLQNEASLAVATNHTNSALQSLPFPLLRLLQGLVNSESAWRSNQERMTSAIEELKREQNKRITGEQVKEMVNAYHTNADLCVTMGTEALHRDVSSFKQHQLAAHQTVVSRLDGFENSLTKMRDQMDGLARKFTQQQTTTSSSFESLNNNLMHTQSDLKERGLIMSRLGEKLMEEVDGMRISHQRMEAKLKEMERRMYIFEYTNAGSATKPSIAAMTASRPATAASTTGATTIADSSNPLSAQSVIQARKRDTHFVTHDSIQSSPPGSAIFKDVAQGLVQSTQQLEEANTHPLAQVIEEHKKELALSGDVKVQVAQEVAGGDSTVVDGAVEKADDTAMTTHPLSGSNLQLNGSVASAPSNNAPPSPPRTQPASVVRPSTTPAAVVAAPHQVPSSQPANSQALQPHSNHPHAQSWQQRYMADYTTRNLQRDLLEIAETYQSTIRNEVDGLRSQLLNLRRNQVEESQRTTSALESFHGTNVTHVTEVKRTLSNFDTLLHRKFDELFSRMSQVEIRHSEVASLGQARAAGIELKYQERNEEIRAALDSLEKRMHEMMKGKIMTHNSSNGRPSTSAGGGDMPSAGNINLSLLQSHLDSSFKMVHDRLNSLTQDQSRHRERHVAEMGEMRRNLKEMHQQMKSLFMDAFVTLHQGSGGGGTNAMSNLFPKLTPASPGAHGSAHPTAAKKSFVLQAKSLNASSRRGAQQGQKQSQAFERDSNWNAQFHTPRPPSHSMAPPTDSLNLMQSSNDELSEEKMMHDPSNNGISPVFHTPAPLASLRSHAVSAPTTARRHTTPRNLLTQESSMHEMEHVLSVAKRDLQNRPATQQQQRRRTQPDTVSNDELAARQETPSFQPRPPSMP